MNKGGMKKKMNLLYICIRKQPITFYSDISWVSLWILFVLVVLGTGHLVKFIFSALDIRAQCSFAFEYI